MSKGRDKIIKNLRFAPERPMKARTTHLLKKAWQQMPTDFSVDERFLFIEIAQKLIKIDENKDVSN